MNFPEWLSTDWVEHKEESGKIKAEIAMGKWVLRLLAAANVAVLIEVVVR